MGPTCSLGPAYLMGFLKLYIFNVSFFFIFFIASKSFSNLDIGVHSKKKNKLEKKKANLFLET